MNLAAGLKRRLRSIPALDAWFARREDEQRFAASVGSLSRGKTLLMQLDAARTPEEHLALSKRLLGPHQVDSEICGFLSFAAEHGPTRRVMEIGTADGGTNFLLAHALPGVELMIGADLRVKNQRILRFFKQTTQRLEYLDGSSYAPETVERVRRVLGGELLDVLFIDGDHTFAGAAADFRLHRQFVRPGGLIAFHDIVPDFKTRYGRDTGRWAGEVPRLWTALKPIFQTREFVDDPGQDGLGIGVLIHDPDAVLPVEVRG